MVRDTFHPVAPPVEVMNETAAGETVPACGSLLAKFIVTVPLGWALNTTVKVAVPPARVVTRPLVGVVTKFLVALSWFVTGVSRSTLL